MMSPKTFTAFVKRVRRTDNEFPVPTARTWHTNREPSAHSRFFSAVRHNTFLPDRHQWMKFSPWNRPMNVSGVSARRVL